MDAEALETLAASIRVHGVIQPLVVTHGPERGRFVLIAGERRWRAARLAGLGAVPAVVKDAVPRAMLELALVENVVRADLAPLEEAAAYRQLIDDFGLTQAAVAERVGRSRASVTNTLRLLALPDRVQRALGAVRSARDTPVPPRIAHGAGAGGCPGVGAGEGIECPPDGGSCATLGCRRIPGRRAWGPEP